MRSDVETQNARYERAKADPIAALILKALHEQDARTYNGNSGDIAGLALAVADDLRERLAWELLDHPGPDPSPASPTWWAGYREARDDLARLVRDLQARPFTLDTEKANYQHSTTDPQEGR